MAKDPAVLFYPKDFLTGTEFFTFEEKGVYIHLLCVQHQLGPIPSSYICRTGVDRYVEVMKKFERDENGNYFNPRMKEEKEKRSKYSESRRKNIMNRYNQSTYEDTHVEHMNIHMGNVNGNGNVDIKKGGAGGKPEKVKHLDCVFLTEAEHAKLTERFGVQLPAIIEKLNNYKASKGKVYKSDYHAILSWVASEIAKPDPGSNGTGAAWSTVLATISTGKYKRGGSGDTKIDDAVKQCGGWYSLGKLTEYQIGQMRQKFIEVYKSE